MYKKVHNPAEFSKKDIYSKGLSFRFYLLGTAIIIAFVFSLVKDFIRIHNE